MVVVDIGLVAFEQGEFGVVVLVYAFIAEDTAQLVDLVESANDEPLEVELGGDAKVEALVERVMVSCKGSRHRPSGHGHQHRGVDLDEPTSVQKATDAVDDAAAHQEDIHHVGVGDEVEVTLTVTLLHIAQAMELFG